MELSFRHVAHWARAKRRAAAVADLVGQPILAAAGFQPAGRGEEAMAGRLGAWEIRSIGALECLRIEN